VASESSQVALPPTPPLNEACFSERNSISDIGLSSECDIQNYSVKIARTLITLRRPVRAEVKPNEGNTTC
jgi:hypothetical protein